jgi:hypothetical protein
MIGGVTLLPYKLMGQLEQLQSLSIWRWNKKTKNVIMLQLLKWYHRCRRRYHLCYRARVVLNRNNHFTLDNSICEHHKCGDNGYNCED